MDPAGRRLGPGGAVGCVLFKCMDSARARVVLSAAFCVFVAVSGVGSTVTFSGRRGRKLPPSCRSQLPPGAPAARFALFMWGSMVVLIPRTGVTREATAALARALGGVRLVVVERSLSTETHWRHAALDQRSAAAQAEAIARQLEAALPADEIVLVGQADGAQVAIELARRLEGSGERDRGPETVRISAVVVAAASPSRADEQPEAEPIATPLHVWAGLADPLAPAGPGLLGWRVWTDAATTFRAFAGADDFLLIDVHEVARRLRRLLPARDASEVLDVS